MNGSTFVRSFGAPVLVAVACALGAALGTRVRFPEIGAAVLFLPYAVLTTALLFSRPRRWWIFLLAAAVGNFWPHWSGGAATSFVLLAEVGNSVRALVAAGGLRRFVPRGQGFDTLRGTAGFLLFATVLGPVAGASIGALAVILHHPGESYWMAWKAWLLSNALTGLAVLPIGLITLDWSGFGKPTARVSPRRLIEGSALALLLLAVGGFVLVWSSAPETSLHATLYAPFPLLLWAAVRFGPRGTCASVLVVALLAIVGAVAGRGPFVADSPAGNVLHLQLFLLVTSVPLLLLSALIQQQRRTAEDLRASQQQYRDVLEDQTELICRFRPDGTFTFVNGACARSQGRSPAELVAGSFWSLVAPSSRRTVEELLAHLSPAQPMASWEQELVPGGGERRWEQWRVHAFFAAGGPISDYQAVGRDITERKRAQEEHTLLQTQRALAEALQEADRHKDEFLAMLGHELRNPLAAIGMVSATLRRTPAADSQVVWARNIISRQVAQLTRLVDDLLDSTRIASGKIQLRSEPLDLASVITTALETFITIHELELTVELPSAPLNVHGDAARLGQLISNLLHNAAKYTPAGGRLRLIAGREGAQIVLRFVDNGVGIPKEMLEKVFEAFTQVDRSRDGALGGLGLGLALVKRLVELHGGTVEAHSEGPGRGSEFVVRLPALPSDPGAEALPGPDVPSQAVEHRRDGAAPREVLVVDDAVDAADSLARFLELEGCHVHVAHDGLAALDTALRLGPAVVFLDLDLPKLDGLEVARRLRSRFASPRMLLVATTGFGQPADRRRTSEAGFDHHLTKPIDPHAIQTLLATTAE